MNNNQIVLKIIRNNRKPLSAYDILDKFQRIKKIQPMTVYRALSVLENQGYIHKSFYHNSYVLCKNSHTEDEITTLTVCKNCGDIEENVTNKNKMALVLNVLDLKKFSSENLDSIEIPSFCNNCTK